MAEHWAAEPPWALRRGPPRFPVARQEGSRRDLSHRGIDCRSSQGAPSPQTVRQPSPDHCRSRHSRLGRTVPVHRAGLGQSRCRRFRRPIAPPTTPSGSGSNGQSGGRPSGLIPSGSVAESEFTGRKQRLSDGRDPRSAHSADADSALDSRPRVKRRLTRSGRNTGTRRKGQGELPKNGLKPTGQPGRSQPA